MLFSNIDSRRYAVLRMAFGLLGFVTLFGLWGESTFFYSDYGWFPVDLAIKITNRREWTVFHAITSPWGVKAVFLLGMTAALGMMVGYRTRLCSWALWVVIVSIQSRNWLNTYGGDAVLRMMLFYLALAPTGSAWSVDEILSPKGKGGKAQEVPVWPMRLMQIQVCLIYFTSGLAKLRGVDWLDGNALGMVLSNPLFARWDYSFFLKSTWFFWMSKVATTVTLFWEIGFPALMLHRWTRYAALGIGVGVHLSILFFFQIHWFAHIMLASYLVFVPEPLVIAMGERVKRVVDGKLREQMPHVREFLRKSA